MSSICIVSNIIDEMIKDQMPDMDVMLLRTLDDLLEYTDNAPIRAEKLYISKEALAGSGIRTSTQTLITLIGTAMCKIDNIIYLTDKEGNDADVIKYILNDNEIENWTIIKLDLSRESMTDYILGNTEDLESKSGLERRAVYRVRKSDYVNDRLNNKEILNQKYESEEELLAQLQDTSAINIPIFDYQTSCKVIHVAGNQSKERTLFSYLLAQYCSYEGKTLIIESDFQYLTLTDMVARSKNIKVFAIDIQDLYEDYINVIAEIKRCPEKIVVITGSGRANRDYDFIFNLLYANLTDTLTYIIKEDNIENILAKNLYNIVMPNTTVDILKVIDKLPTSYNTGCNFVCIDTFTLEDMLIKNIKQLRAFMKELLHAQQDMNVSILKLTSCKLGGESHDLRMYLI